MNNKVKTLIISLVFIVAIGLLILFVSSNMTLLGGNANNAELTSVQSPLIKLDEKYGVNNESYKLSADMVTDDYISVNSFCETTNCSVTSENKIEKNGFTFDLALDGYAVKNLGGELCANIYALCNKLGFNCNENQDGFDLVRTFSTKRLLATSFTDTYNAKEVIEYNGLTYLQYQTEYDCYLAYNNLAQNGKASVDSLIKVEQTQDAVLLSNTVGFSCSQWDGNMMGFDEYKDYLSSLSQKSEEIIVAVLDTGIYPNHELFQDRLCTEYAKSFNKLDVFNDVKGHGTHVAGTIAYWTPSNVKILPLRLFDNQGCGYSSYFIESLKYIISLLDKGVNIKVLNCSFGFTISSSYEQYYMGTEFDTTYMLIKEITDRGVAVVSSAGNSGRENYYMAPAAYQEVISISSMYSSRIRAESASHGRVDFCLPGVEIVSAGLDFRSYVTKSGTSMAAPHMSACFALLFSNPTMSFSSYTEIVDLLKTKCTLDYGKEGYDVYFGYGLVDLRGLLYEKGEQPVRTFYILPVLANANHEILSSENAISPYEQGYAGMQYYNKDNKFITIEFKSSYSFYGTNPIKTCSSLFLYCLCNKGYEFYGWYIGTQSDTMEGATFISSSPYYALDLDASYDNHRLYIYLVVDIKIIEVNVAFIYKDVQEYTGFASYGTNLTLSYKDDKKQSQIKRFTCGMFAEEQVFVVKACAGEYMHFNIYCENDSVVKSVYYVGKTMFADVNVNTGTYSSSWISVPAYNDEDMFSIIVMVEI